MAVVHGETHELMGLGVGFNDSEGQLTTALFDARTNEIFIGNKDENLSINKNLDSLFTRFNSSTNALNVERKFSEARIMLEAAAEALEFKLEIEAASEQERANAAKLLPSVHKADKTLEEQQGIGESRTVIKTLDR